MSKDYRSQVKALVLDEESFVRLVLKGQVAESNPWRQVVVRPVLLKSGRHLQFSYFNQKQDITKNYRNNEAEARLDEVLALPFYSVAVQSTSGEKLFQVTKKGVILHKGQGTLTAEASSLAHDASKQLALPAGRPDAFLQATGVMDEQGHVRPSMHDKFTQINEFLKLLEHTGELERLPDRQIELLDCGCGSAYLSFAAYHYLNDVRKIPARLVGIDVNETLIRKDNAESTQLGFTQTCFERSAILDYRPAPAPDIVLALHACDTATDEALYQGIVHEALLILCAPCCHHHLQQQLHVVAPLGALFHDGILKHRLGDILTDTFRALVLRILGYRADVVEFVAPEHTDKNLMIRAVRRPQGTNAAAVKEYLELKQFWGVTPYLETLLGERLQKHLHE
ncbi:MAG TPA: SAM-dependent methyltransferase [Ktedonobacteraceae bacterium]